MELGQFPQRLPDILREKIIVHTPEQIENQRSAAKLAAATLKHAIDNTKVN